MCSPPTARSSYAPTVTTCVAPTVAVSALLTVAALAAPTVVGGAAPTVATGAAPTVATGATRTVAFTTAMIVGAWVEAIAAITCGRIASRRACTDVRYKKARTRLRDECHLQQYSAWRLDKTN
ncbi:hypothetical protein PF004_g12873 [Phytophthora fragariae]|uniref:Uncharacterized protein n=1 Tax=Phytophthora fragariae TaxID=53985 RepID=A0A6G0NTU3_9STRA|nr:hypothetical protein PF004_g12873 [Phytophthora fragariae]